MVYGAYIEIDGKRKYVGCENYFLKKFNLVDSPVCCFGDINALINTLETFPDSVILGKTIHIIDDCQNSVQVIDSFKKKNDTDFVNMFKGCTYLTKEGRIANEEDDLTIYSLLGEGNTVSRISYLTGFNEKSILARINSDNFCYLYGRCSKDTIKSYKKKYNDYYSYIAIDGMFLCVNSVDEFFLSKNRVSLYKFDTSDMLNVLSKVLKCPKVLFNKVLPNNKTKNIEVRNFYSNVVEMKATLNIY